MHSGALAAAGLVGGLLGVDREERLGVIGRKLLVRYGGICFHRVLGQLHSCRRRAFTGAPLACAGYVGLSPRGGLRACLASAGTRRQRRPPQPSAPVVLGFGEFAWATGLRCCGSDTAPRPFGCGGLVPREGGAGCSAGRAGGAGLHKGRTA